MWPWPREARPDAPALGGWLTTPSEAVLDTFRRSALDYVGIDCQHTVIDVATAATLIAARPGAGKPVLVRVPDQGPAGIGRVLDAGADGVIVPMVDSVDDAVAVVAAMRYAPRGARSFGPIRPDLGTDPAAVEQRARCFVMIETARALADVDAICAVDGVDGVYIGPADLSIALGFEPLAAFTTGQLDDVVRRVAAAATQAGVVAGIHSIGGRNARHWLDLGCAMTTLTSDVAMLADACARHIETALGGEATVAGGSGLYH